MELVLAEEVEPSAISEDDVAAFVLVVVSVEEPDVSREEEEAELSELLAGDLDGGALDSGPTLVEVATTVLLESVVRDPNICVNWPMTPPYESLVLELELDGITDDDASVASVDDPCVVVVAGAELVVTVAVEAELGAVEPPEFPEVGLEEVVDSTVVCKSDCSVDEDDSGDAETICAEEVVLSPGVVVDELDEEGELADEDDDADSAPAEVEELEGVVVDGLSELVCSVAELTSVQIVLEELAEEEAELVRFWNVGRRSTVDVSLTTLVGLLVTLSWLLETALVVAEVAEAELSDVAFADTIEAMAEVTAVSACRFARPDDWAGSPNPLARLAFAACWVTVTPLEPLSCAAIPASPMRRW